MRSHIRQFLARNTRGFGSKHGAGSTANTPASTTAASTTPDARNTPAASTILALVLVLAGFSCAPPADFIDLSIEATASSSPIYLGLSEVLTDSVKFVWSPPAHYGTKIGGALLSKGEIAYQVYYIEWELDAEPPTTEQIKNIAISSSTSQRETTVRGETEIKIDNLNPGTRYFFTVAAYNSFAATSTLSLEKKEVIMPLSFQDDLAYTKTEHELTVHDSTFTIAPSMVPKVNTNLVSPIVYSLEIIEGAFPDTVFNINKINGDIVIDPTVTGTAKFVAIVEAEGYLSQEVMFTVRIIPRVAGAVGNLRTDGEEDRLFVVRWNVPSETGTRQDGTILESEELVYRVYYLSRDAEPEAEALVQEASTQSKVEETQGITNVRLLDLAEGTRYFVTVETYNPFTEVSTFSETVVSETTTTGTANLMGTLSYNQSEYTYLANSPTVSIIPKTKPTVTGETPAPAITYDFYRRGGVQFSNSTVTLDRATGTITVNPSAATTPGVVDYRVFTRVSGFNSQHIEIKISITQIALEVTPYYSQESSSDLPVPIGLAIAVEDPKLLGNDDVVLSIESPEFGSESDGEYKIHIEDGTSLSVLTGYGTIFTKTPIDNRITITTLEIEEVLGTSTWPEGSVYLKRFGPESEYGSPIGLSGPGIAGIQDIAIYKPGDIYGWRDFQAIQYNLYYDYYVLKNDIVFPEAEEGTSNFEPLGNYDEWFWGTLDGGGFSITGIRVESDNSHVGLFGYTYTGSRINDVIIKDLTLIDCTFIGRNQVGSIVGKLVRGVLENVSAETRTPGAGRIEGHTTGRDVGGLVGYNVGGLIREGYSNVPVKGITNVGGLVGASQSGGLVILNTGQHVDISGYSTGDVIGTENVGGLVGRTIRHKKANVTGYSTGNVTGTTKVGGLVGMSNSGSGKTKGYSTGNVTGDVHVGGLVGYIESGENVTGYAIGDVTGKENVGGMFGFVYFAEILIGYSRGNVYRSEGNKPHFGKTVGQFHDRVPETMRVRTYSSIGRSTESQLYNINIDGATGENGNPINIRGINSINLFSELFNPEEISDWAWMGRGEWPALNLGDIISPRDQPIGVIN